MIYITVFNDSTDSLQNRSTILPLFIGPYTSATVWHFSMKALAMYQVILLGEQRHIRCEQLTQGCCRSRTRDLLITSPMRVSVQQYTKNSYVQ